ncbi:hypothetical protein PFAG_05880 [Plasmodium falciparum Santa Lucia]|uniref:Uncharacterized protein n=6 Tax=Plasmodium falciparum TaxID=5833 RepID=A0A024VYX2_PLAFA|nr:hypothetical protein PFFVO_05434 [Plasmodium falciparum Vietnam Oak-Knoll (FVO)]ETW33513.1 hypothetical protein PFTANZ_05761 [Plasmodium falciparum Tanzania (2000708)]ETW39299.1 hypothetical protein PFNF135_06322 [Plasmodium falciparum NF135/5.C10]ETW58769.1 hypothetical protein PFMC_05862 [Plasmodium falciparum CAMP/Malaysia]EUR62145.1 hypothetical protein PFBG_05859 [Plasmodium falciparum 7G8]EUT79313.1 hypothetical protein PFAG_05880 [Plasmodium falciparum Santa Lucia]
MISYNILIRAYVFIHLHIMNIARKISIFCKFYIIIIKRIHHFLQCHLLVRILVVQKNYAPKKRRTVILK